jgi:hypothetical protein
MTTPTAPLTLDAAPEIVAIREALAAFPKGWSTVFQQVREREPGVVEIGALWEDSDDLAEVVTIDTGNYYDNAAAMPMARFIAACNPAAMTAVLATIAQFEARLREAEAKAADYDRLASIARNRRMVLEEIAGSKPLTATPQQFADHLQRLARKTVNDYSFAGNDDDAAIAAHGKDERL